MTLINWYTLIGLLAQFLFAARMLVQWVMSEKAREVVNPALFWWLSLIGALLMTFYGFLRHDLAIMLGQLISYYVYCYNLKLKKEFVRTGKIFAVLLIVIPAFLTASEIMDMDSFKSIFLNKNHIPYWLLALGFIGQFLFTGRFVYQLYVSYKIKHSILPDSFWVLSLIAAILVQIYGLLRLDIVLILGQIGGIITYVRNLVLSSKKKKSVKNESGI